MERMVRKPNVTDLARYPFYPLRYYILTENVNSEKTGMYKTHRTTEGAIRSLSFTHLRIVDLQKNIVSKPYEVPKYGRFLLRSWRKNYFDVDYDLIAALEDYIPGEDYQDEE